MEKKSTAALGKIDKIRQTKTMYSYIMKILDIGEYLCIERIKNN